MEKRNNYFSWIIATWFGSGLLPIAPGTWGSLAAFPFAYIIAVNIKGGIKGGVNPRTNSAPARPAGGEDLSFKMTNYSIHA